MKEVVKDDGIEFQKKDCIGQRGGAALRRLKIEDARLGGRENLNATIDIYGIAVRSNVEDLAGRARKLSMLVFSMVIRICVAIFPLSAKFCN